MNTSLILLLLFAVCFVFLAHFPQNAQAKETKKVCFEYDTQVEIEAKCHIYTFSFGKTTEECHDGKMNQCFEIDVTGWENWKFPDNACMHFRVKGKSEAFAEAPANVLYNNTGSVYYLGNHP
ncbi:hypothetical protein niasHT_017678 [Heterodera trifolii]|uniref:Effector protein n=1 Tax=Heterodera trifolii TaxID=157864 RepID=A0ABD2L8B2_9BILA